MDIHSLLQNCDVSFGKAAISAASNTNQQTTPVDMAGFSGVMFILPIADSVATGVATLQGQVGDASNGSDAADVSGASASATCAVDDDINDKYLIVDMPEPKKRYARAKITSATANIAFGVCTVIRYRPKRGPVTQGASVQASKVLQA